ncbi:MAG: hypothetical protein ABSB76_23880 [Streptosporangiaceae bacterium]|jgi:hypothetical protein
MNLVSDIDPPPFEDTAPDFSADCYHQQFFPRSRATGGVEGIYGIDKLPIIWWGSSQLNPNRGPEPYVS